MSIPQYLDALAAAMNLEVERFERPGVTVVPGEDRRGERLVSHYQVREHSVLWIDPDLADFVSPWDGRTTSASFPEVAAWAADNGGTRVGAGLEHLLPDGVEMPPRPPEVTTLDGKSAETIELVRTMQAGCSDDDNEEADFDLDALDDFLVGWIEDIDGVRTLTALAGGRTFEPRPGFMDVGVLVHPDARGLGRGRAVIAGVVDDVRSAGQTPLYRCNVENLGSRALCRGLGFQQVIELEAFTF